MEVFCYLDRLGAQGERLNPLLALSPASDCNDKVLLCASILCGNITNLDWAKEKPLVAATIVHLADENVSIQRTLAAVSDNYLDLTGQTLAIGVGQAESKKVLCLDLFGFIDANILGWGECLKIAYSGDVGIICKRILPSRFLFFTAAVQKLD